MEIVTTSHPEDPQLDMQLTESLLKLVAKRQRPELVRVFRPGPTVAFGRVDRALAGFDAACEVSRTHNRAPVVRLGGGHAAAYDQCCVVVEVIRRKERIVGGLDERFIELVDLLTEALGRVGVSVEVGELPGEYCPGRYSLHLPAGPKLAGVAQRIVSGASLTTAVLVVDGGDDLRTVLADVYAALELAIDPSAAGAITDRHQRVSVEAVQDAIIQTIADQYQPEP